MRPLIFLLFITILFASCGSKKVPSDIIAKEKMGTIIWQLQQADEYINNLLVKDSTKKAGTEKMKIYQQVFDLNKTSMDEFKKSYQFYMAHPDISKIMFDSISAKAERLRADKYKSNVDTSAKHTAIPIEAQRPGFDTAAAKRNQQQLKLNRLKIDSAAGLALPHVKPNKNKTDSAALKSTSPFLKLRKPKHNRLKNLPVNP